ncbi:hypothetical protein NEOLEDRAFT_1152442 [Neolentinus lepideus HHB14362 ss-1]|uniref:DUF4470 domain-containing protein n=1 Tax=Neolentinus lepideus HHB14362 ss-1 TaxID=1314782 RepID=A0A165MSM1_9AGAM|nr:hypothetical protein NEOLEDRAFT_1152442 [Neolentinus lepideus HHB14362 ss-1]
MSHRPPRNILLYVLIFEGEPIDKIWNIYYHFFIDEASSAVLAHHCEMLLAQSNSVVEWHEYKYGSWLKVLDSLTLADIRTYWQSYVDFRSIDSGKNARMRKEFDKLAAPNRNGFNYGCARCTGPLMPQAMATMSELYQVQLAKLINPTFVYSLDGEKFEPHYGTFPLQSFHLAHAFAPIPSVSTPVGSEDMVIQTAKEQFAAWCGRFREVRGTVVHLDSIRSTASPTSFDVIDTSNLTDYLGLIHILLVSVPLLKTDPDRNAILYTETLLPSGRMRRVMSVFIGLAPRPLLTGFQSTSHSNELVIHHVKEGITDQFHQRVSWVRPIDGDPLHGVPATLVLGSESSAHDLGALLFRLYDNIGFEHNGIGEVLRLSSLKSAQALFENSRAMEKIYYNRRTVAKLFRFARDRIEVSDSKWENAIGVFLMKVQTDSSRLVGMKYIQDLCLQFHIEGVHTTDILRNDWMHCHGIQPLPSKLFRGWSDIPLVVCVVLTVPRHAFRPFLEWKDDELFGSPVLHMQFDTQDGHSNSFSSLHGVAGELDLSSEDPKIQEVKPFFDAASFVFSCWLPTWLITSVGLKVGLTIQSTPRMVENFMSQLGPMLMLYSARILDTDSVRILRSRPGILSELDIASSGTKTLSSLSDSLSHRPRVAVNLSMSKIPALTGQLDICDEAAKIALVGKAAVSIGVFKYIVTYPLAIIGEKSKLRIARKSGYIEILSQARTAGKPNWRVGRAHERLGLFKNNPRVFGLAEPSRGGVHTLLFIYQLRLDLAAFTVVADIAVLPLDNGLMPQLRPRIQALQDHGGPCVTTTRGWKRRRGESYSLPWSSAAARGITRRHASTGTGPIA